MDITKPDPVQHGQFVTDNRHRFEKFDTLFNGHIQHIGNGFALEFNLKRFAVIARAMALVAANINVRQEMHFNFYEPVARAGFTAPAFDIE